MGRTESKWLFCVQPESANIERLARAPENCVRYNGLVSFVRERTLLVRAVLSWGVCYEGGLCCARVKGKEVLLANPKCMGTQANPQKTIACAHVAARGMGRNAYLERGVGREDGGVHKLRDSSVSFPYNIRGAFIQLYVANRRVDVWDSLAADTTMRIFCCPHSSELHCNEERISPAAMLMAELLC